MRKHVRIEKVIQVYPFVQVRELTNQIGFTMAIEADLDTKLVHLLAVVAAKSGPCQSVHVNVPFLYQIFMTNLESQHRSGGLFVHGHTLKQAS